MDNKGYPVEHGAFLVRPLAKLKGTLSGDKLEEEDAEAKDVGLVGGLAGGEVLWSDVADGATDGGGDMRVSMVEKLGEAKVADHRLAAVVEENVGSLHITVNYLWVALLVEVQQTPRCSQRYPFPRVPVQRRFT